VLFALCSACATTGATWQSGVGDKTLEHPPWFAGETAPVAPGSIAHFPIAYQRGATQPPNFDPDGKEGSSVARLLAEMNRVLDSLRGGPALDRALPPDAVPPDVRFGCINDPSGDCAEEGDALLAGGSQAMRLSVGRPSQAWIDWTATLRARENVTHVLVMTLEVSNYLVRQRGIAGSKEVELGNGYTMKLPWLTSLETPVAVVQLTGALVGPDGRAVRVGAEGLLAKRTSLPLSSIGAQELITEDDIARLRDLRREDLPGNPVAWEVALQSLSRSLAGDVD
jgi:hypothetical protein